MSAVISLDERRIRKIQRETVIGRKGGTKDVNRIGFDRSRRGYVREVNHVRNERHRSISTLVSLMRYHLLLGIVPLTLLGSIVVHRFLGVPLESALIGGGTVAMLALVDGLFLRPRTDFGALRIAVVLPITAINDETCCYSPIVVLWWRFVPNKT